MKDKSYELVVQREGFLIVAKAPHIATVPLSHGRGTPSLLEELGKDFPEVLQPFGRYAHEGTVIHRLDTATTGLVVVATSLPWYEHFLHVQQQGKFLKSYIAETTNRPSSQQGFPNLPAFNISESCIIQSKFRPYGPNRVSVRPVIDEGKTHMRKEVTKEMYSTNVHVHPCGSSQNEFFMCSLTKGFRHQIRVHLAWIGHPIIGDTLYGGIPSETLHLAAYEVRFPDLNSKEELCFRWENPPIWATALT